MKTNTNTQNKQGSKRVTEYILTLKIEELANITIDNIARELNISRTQLWRNFKKENKISLEKYITRIKINLAALLLLNNADLNVKEIAERLGYCRCDYFIKVFNKHFGISPGRYRELKRTNE